ncbi:unnamed protein product [Nezara viridula]|uniref:Uncharacterized protein n=1 Tax=Nezara viridula TaxID=85310 RepID=A0A9P0MQL4_NEZVI|nr:unnamed protein product [Nezara viridula]
MYISIGTEGTSVSKRLQNRRKSSHMCHITVPVPSPLRKGTKNLRGVALHNGHPCGNTTNSCHLPKLIRAENACALSPLAPDECYFKRPKPLQQYKLHQSKTARFLFLPPCAHLTLHQYCSCPEGVTSSLQIPPPHVPACHPATYVAGTKWDGNHPMVPATWTYTPARSIPRNDVDSCVSACHPGDRCHGPEGYHAALATLNAWKLPC